MKALIPRAGERGAVLVRKLWTNPGGDHQAADITVGILLLPADTPPVAAFALTLAREAFADLGPEADHEAIGRAACSVLADLVLSHCTAPPGVLDVML